MHGLSNSAIYFWVPWAVTVFKFICLVKSFVNAIFEQLGSSWQEFNWLYMASRGPSAIGEPLVNSVISQLRNVYIVLAPCWTVAYDHNINSANPITLSYRIGTNGQAMPLMLTSIGRIHDTVNDTVTLWITSTSGSRKWCFKIMQNILSDQN